MHWSVVAFVLHPQDESAGKAIKWAYGIQGVVSSSPWRYIPLPQLSLYKKAMTECPVCGAELSLSDDLVKGELLECDDCGTELEVTSLDPVKVEEAPEAEEDWGQ